VNEANHAPGEEASEVRAGVGPYRSVEIVVPQSPFSLPRGLGGVALAVGVCWLAICTVPIVVSTVPRPAWIVGGLWALLEIAWAAHRRTLQCLWSRSSFILAMMLAVLPPWNHHVERDLLREVALVRAESRQFHATHGRWPRGFEELPSYARLDHTCTWGINCLEWKSAPAGQPQKPYMMRWVYTGFARMVYFIDQDDERFLG